MDNVQGLKKRCLSVEGRPTMMVVTSNVDGARDICLVSPEKVGGSGPVVVDMCWWWWWVLFILGNPIKF